MVRLITYTILGVIILSIMVVGAITPNLIEFGYKTDKMLHLLAFCIPMLLFTLKYLYTPKALVLFGLFLALLGGGIEIIQHMSEHRTAQWGDALSNVLGISFGALIGYLLRTGYYAGAFSNNE